MTSIDSTAASLRARLFRSAPRAKFLALFHFRAVCRYVTYALALAIVLFQSSCKQTQPAAANAGPPPPTVTTSAGEQRKIVDSEIATARLDAIESVEVRPRVSGHITEIHFSAGQLVKKGDLLFVIDRRW